MLEGLDRIEWKALNHAYGSAEDVPDLIRALTHEDDDIRDKTLYALYSNIWHQGTVYQATAYAVPFLIELLTDDHVTRKYDILIYLAHLAHGNSYLEVHADLMAHRNRDTQEFELQLAEEFDHVRQTYQEVCDGLPVYFDLLSNVHEELHTRMAVAYLLACLTDHHATIVPRLMQLLPDEQHSLMRGSLILALRHLLYGETNTDFLEPYLAPDEDLIVRVCSAMAIAQLKTDQTPMRVISLLINILTNSTVVDEPYEQLTWSEGDILGDICKSLMNVSYNQLKTVIPDMIQALRRVDFYNAPTYIDAMMMILFDGQPLSADATGNDLTPYQRRMLHTILDSPAIWQIRLNDGKTMLNGNISSLMAAYNLPNKPDDMRDFLG